MRYKFNYFLNQLPFVEGEIRSKNKAIRSNLLIDTGADYSIFPRSVAERLGIHLDEGEVKVLEGAGGKIVSYLHHIELKICNKTIAITACFCEKEDIPEHIIGRKDIINHFALIFTKKYFELVEYE